MVNRYNNIVKINIIQWNAQSVKPKLLSFQNILQQEKIHIAALSETWLDPSSALQVKEYNVFRKDRADSYGGVALFVHRSLRADLLHISSFSSGIEMIGIKVHNCDAIDNIISLYCPPSARTHKREWDSLFSSFSKKTLILGDFNGHHTNWSNKIDSRGGQIYDALEDHLFCSLNDGTPTRVHLVNGQCRQSAPDISLVSSDIVLQFNWTVLNESLGSDHLMIKISTEFNALPNNLRRNYKKANWQEYKNCLEVLLKNFDFKKDFQTSYDIFIKHLNIAADLHIPYIKMNPNPANKFRPKPYWNPDLSKSVAERRLALSKFRRNPTPHNFNILHEKIQQSQRKIRNDSDKSWQTFCNSLDHSSNLNELWHKMRWLKGRSSPRNIVCKDESVKLLERLTPDYVTPFRPTFSSINVSLEARISLHELHSCMKNKDTAPGSDDISYSMIKNLPTNGKTALLQLFNIFFTNSFVPIQWRDIVIIPIPKPGSGPESPTSLRPISMISCVCKIFHGILIKRLEWHIEKNNILLPATTGFRKSRSSLENLSTLTSRIQVALSKQLITIGCFMDLEDAYNNIDISVLLESMDTLGIGSKLCSYLWNFLSDRNLKIKIDNSFMCRKTGKGLAQGDPFSPLLFNIATVSLCKCINTDNASISQYADDFVLYLTCKNTEIGSQILQLEINKFVHTATQLGLLVSSAKSKVCIFRRGYKNVTVNLTVNNSTLHIANYIKHLGLWLDYSLRWKQHIKELKARCSKFINVFKVLIGPGWGIHPIHLRRLYISIVRSRLDYASFLFANSCNTHLGKLDKIQNQYMRIIGGFIKSTPIHVMESELYLHPLGTRRYGLAGKFWFKSASILESELAGILDELNTLCQNRYWRCKSKPLLTLVHNQFKSTAFHKSKTLECFSLNTWMSNVNLTNIVNTEIETINNAKKRYNSIVLKDMCMHYINNRYNDFYSIYTDGCKGGDGSGMAILDIQSKTSVKLQVNTNMSIMHIELIAIAEAVAYIDSLAPGNYVIFTDSKSALQHILKCTTTVFRGLPIAYDIIKSIFKILSNGKNICMQWIPSHIGLPGNEEVDHLAKQASFSDLSFDGLPCFSDLFFVIKERCYDMWKEHFDQRSLIKGIWYKTIQPSLPRSPWFAGLKLSRQDIVVALRLRSGHIPLNGFAHLVGKSDSPKCSECNIIEDVYHVLVECVRNEVERLYFVNNFKINLRELAACNIILARPVSREARTLYELYKANLKRRQ